MSELNVTSAKLGAGLYHEIISKEELHIECNWCTEEGSVFYAGPPNYTMHTDDWIAKAVAHLFAEHPEKMEL